MPEIDFQPERRTIEDLFVGPEYYVIPRFQRPYSWNQSNLDDFWRDVVFDNDVGYFIGPMVAWRDAKSSIRRVVDGQQRLTTVAIMFAVLRDEFQKLGENNLATGVNRYLQKANRDNEIRFTLQTEAEARFLTQAIFKFPSDDSVEPQTDEERALASAFTQIEQRIVGEMKQRSKPVKWLQDLRDRLLGLRVIWVEHKNEDDAYILFETLNSRGKDLEVVDLLKNHIFNKLRGDGISAADVVRTKWADMRTLLESEENHESIDANRFILHWWLSQHEYVAQRKLFRAIKAEIKTKVQGQATFKSLLNDAPLYRNVIDPTTRTWPSEELQARRSLQALADFRVVQPAPLLLSLLRARTEKPKLPAGHFRVLLQTIERYHFQYTVVTQSSSSGGVSEMYAKAARELKMAGTDQNERVAVIRDITAKLVSRQPARDQFVAAFRERFLFSNEYTRDSRLVRYVLTELLRHVNPSTITDDLSIEHILPQQAIKSGTTADIVGSIGNLLLVSHNVNTKLDNKAFSDKKSILLGAAGRAFDIGGVADKDKWGASEIRARAKYLAELAYDEVWRLPCK